MNYYAATPLFSMSSDELQDRVEGVMADMLEGDKGSTLHVNDILPLPLGFYLDVKHRGDANSKYNTEWRKKKGITNFNQVCWRQFSIMLDLIIIHAPWLVFPKEIHELDLKKSVNVDDHLNELFFLSRKQLAMTQKDLVRGHGNNNNALAEGSWIASSMSLADKALQQGIKFIWAGN